MHIPIPLPKTRKGAIITMAIVIALCLVAAVVVFIFWTRDQETLKRDGQPSFNTLSMNQLKDGLIVKGKIDMSFGAYAETYETNYGIRTSKDSDNLYYIIPIYDTDNEGYIHVNYAISYEADPQDFKTMDKIIDQTFDDGSTNDASNLSELNVDNGLVLDLNSDYKKYLNEWTEAPDFYENGSFIDWCAEYNVFGTTDKDVIRSKIVPYVIDKTATAGTDLTILWLMLGIAVLCVIVLLVLILYKKPLKGFPDPRDGESGMKQFIEMDNERK